MLTSTNKIDKEHQYDTITGTCITTKQNNGPITTYTYMSQFNELKLNVIYTLRQVSDNM